jgi:bifunctional ADP-heptose synthase (sugar kinase/adenylyltransferase)
MDIQQLKQSKILLIGDSCTDVYHYGNCSRLSSEAPVPIFKHVRSEEHGGMACNVYNNLCNLSNEIHFLTNERNITKERFIDITSYHHLMRFDTGENTKTKTISKNLIKKTNIKQYDGVVISDYNKGFISPESALDICSKAYEHKIPVFVDSKKKDLSCFENCIIKINEHEYNSATNLPKNCDLVVTYSEKGAMWNGQMFAAHDNEIDKLSVSSSNRLLANANICGAGDTFLSGFVTYYLSSGDIPKSVKFANICASIAVENFGTYAITLEDLKNV